MNVLIVGGYGFIGSHLAEKYYKEGYKVFILDNLSTAKVKKLKINHKLFNMDSNDILIDQIFKNYCFDAVIYLIRPSSTSLLGLKNILLYASGSNVKRFIYLSDIHKFDMDINIKSEESLCMVFDSINNMSVCIIRMTKIYGERQYLDDYERFLKQCNLENADYIYIADAVYGIYMAEKNIETKIINIRMETSNNEREINDLSFNIRYSIIAGIEKTKKWYEKEKKNKKRKESIANNKFKCKKYIPLLENIFLAVLGFLLNKLFILRYSENLLDFNYIYIIIISAIYGMKYSVLAIVMSIFGSICIYISQNNGHYIVSLFDNNMLIKFVLYILIGFLLSYIIDNKNQKIASLLSEKNENNDKFDFIYNQYIDVRNNKKKLEEQIINKEDSLIGLYNIIKKLDYLDPNMVFDNAAIVVSEIMKCKETAIYIRTTSKKYLRILSKTKLCRQDLKNSIDLKQYYEIEKAIDSGDVFINKSFKRGIPMMMCPVNVGENVTLLVGIVDVDFELLNLYQKNLFKVVLLLISDALKRAYQYDLSLKNEKYIDDTNILKEEYFKKIVNEKYSKEDIANDNIILLIKKYKYDALINCVRVGDYIGKNHKNQVFLLLSNIKIKDLNIVIKRLNSAQIEANIVDKNYVLS